MMQVKGLDKLYSKLNRLEKTGAKRALRKATRAGTTVLGKAVKAETPVHEGLLKKAETTKVGGKGVSLYGIAGADVAKLKADSEESKGTRPTNIDWLVEYGHIAPDGTFIPPSGFMRRAAAEAKPRAEAVFARKLATEIERELSR